MEEKEEQEPEALDFSIRPYEEWIEFLFDRKVAPQDDGKYSSSSFFDYEFERHPQRPAVFLEYLTRICRELPGLVERYGFEKIDQGLWAVLIGLHFSPSITELLWDSTIPLECRIECIRSMRLVYTEVVAKIPEDVEMVNIFYMWWDLLDLYPPTNHAMRDHPNDDRANEKLLVDVALNILKEILEIDDERCHSSALHGLGHLLHPRRAALVQDFIDRHRDECDEAGIKWLEECRDGTVM